MPQQPKNRAITTSSKSKSYKELEKRLVRVVRRGRLITCLIPKGLPRTSCRGKNRYQVSVGGYTMSAPRLVYIHKRGSIEEKTPVFNLCFDSDCCKPSHLVAEVSPYSRSRKNCYGYLSREGCDTLIKVCPHTPACIRVTKMESLEAVNPEDIDPGMRQDPEGKFREVIESEEEPESESEEEPSEESSEESSEEEPEPAPEPVSRRTRVQLAIKSIKK